MLAGRRRVLHRAAGSNHSTVDLRYLPGPGCRASQVAIQRSHHGDGARVPPHPFADRQSFDVESGRWRTADSPPNNRWNRGYPGGHLPRETVGHRVRTICHPPAGHRTSPRFNTVVRLDRRPPEFASRPAPQLPAPRRAAPEPRSARAPNPHSFLSGPSLELERPARSISGRQFRPLAS